MNNQGLEALAALASAAPAGETPSQQTSTAKNSAQSGDTKVAALGTETPGTHTNNAVPSGPGPTAPGTAISASQLASLVNSNPQQWQQAQALLSAASGANQAVAAAATTTTAGPALTPGNLGLLSSLRQAPAPATDASAMLAMQQQMNYINFLVQSQSAQQKIQPPPATAGGLAGLPTSSQALQLALSGATAASLLQNTDGKSTGRQVLPTAPVAGAPPPVPQATASAAASSSATMPPPKPSTQPITVSTASIPSPSSSSQPALIAPQPPGVGAAGTLFDEWNASYESKMRDKKKQKRAANRRSAQLSRKRKKVFIEELKEENDDLRRKEQILKSIPDLIVVFDSSGQLWFVSASVSRFLSFTASELEGTSFWDRLCEDSVRLLKAAFMDSLAARKPDSDTAPLGSGVWELRLVDKDGSQITVALNGVVHFAGERPECVCSLRPRDEEPAETESEETDEKVSDEVPQDRASGSSVSFSRSLIRVHPQQSVVSNGSSSDGRKRKRARAVASKRGEAVRISDSGNSSVESESGSSDETTGVAS